MANGAKARDYSVVDAVNPDTISDNNSVDATNVVYTIKNAAGKDVTGAFVSKNGTSLTVKTVTAAGAQYQKHLAAGTYYVTGKFKVKDKDANNHYVANTLKEVVVSGSFTVKDSQDTAATAKVKKNDLNTTLSTAFTTDGTDPYVEVSYDGQRQTLNGNVAKIHGTVAGNTAYVTSVEVFVKITGPNNNYVLVTVPVNQKFTNVSGAETITIEP